MKNSDGAYIQAYDAQAVVDDARPVSQGSEAQKGKDLGVDRALIH